MNNGQHKSPQIPIPGAAGEAVRVALQSLAMYVGEASVNISKQRVKTGGYIYVISKLNATNDGGETERA